MTSESDLRLPDGRTLHLYDTAPGDARRLVVFWHHGTPNIGAPPAPLLALSERLGLRWVSFDRPGYAGSARHVGRTLGTVVGDLAYAADALGIERFAVVGHSGGASHALVTAAALGERVVAAVGMASLAPFDANGLNWFGGMIRSGVAALTVASQGLAAKEAYVASGVEYDSEFTAADLAAFEGEWGWFGDVVRPAIACGPAGGIDDDIAYVSPWGHDPAAITAPVLLLHGGQDGVAPIAHAEWLAAHIPTATLRREPAEAHISIITHAASGLEWLATHR